MDQDITISTNIVKYFYEDLTNGSLETSNSQKCYLILKQNFLIVDKDKKHFQQILIEIDKLPKTKEKDNLKKNILGLILHRAKPIQNSLESKNGAYHLAESSYDKIFFDPMITEDDKQTKLLELQFNIGKHDIELYTSQNLISPDMSLRLKNVPFEVQFEKDKKYDLIKLLNPIIRNCKQIEIRDPYIRNNKAIYHLKKIRELNTKASLKVKTIPIEMIPTDRNDLHYNDKELKKIIGPTNLSYYQSYLNKNNKYSIPHKERYILTEKFRIRLPGGLDQFNEKGYPNMMEDEDIMEMSIKHKEA